MLQVKSLKAKVWSKELSIYISQMDCGKKNIKRKELVVELGAMCNDKYMDQVVEFVKKQLAQGKTEDQVKDLLRTNGWQEQQIQTIFTDLRPIETSPIPATQASSSAPPTVDPTTQPKKWILPMALSFLTLAILGGGVWGYQKYFVGKNKTSSSISKPPSTNVYTSDEISFNYPSAWKVRDSSFIGTGNISAEIKADSPDLLRYFFKADDITAIQKEIDALPKSDVDSNGVADDTTIAQVFALLQKAISEAQLTIQYKTNTDCGLVPTDLAPGVSAESKCTTIASQDSAKSQLTDLKKSDDRAAIDPAKIQQITVAGASAFWVAENVSVESAGFQAITTIHLAIPTKNGSVLLNFSNAKDITALSSEQKIIYDSIKLL